MQEGNSEDQPIDFRLTIEPPYTFNPFKIIIAALRLLWAVMIIALLYTYHKFIYPLIFIDFVRRYITCITNLLWIRLLLVILGFREFENSSYKFFDKRSTQRFTLRSGYIGIGNHSNIVDFLFYSYILSPLFVKLVIFKLNNGQEDIMYLPLTFLQAFECALTGRGFEPQIIHQDQINKIKARRLKMHLLVVESFQNLKGPIFILLPGIHHKRYLPVHPKIVEALSGNEQKFSRWTIGFCVTQDDEIFGSTYRSQLMLIYAMITKMSFSSMKVVTNQFHRNNYASKPFIDEIDEFYERCDLKKMNMSYTNYIEQFQKEEVALKHRFRAPMQNAQADHSKDQ